MIQSAQLFGHYPRGYHCIGSVACFLHVTKGFLLCMADDFRHDSCVLFQHFECLLWHDIHVSDEDKAFDDHHSCRCCEQCNLYMVAYSYCRYLWRWHRHGHQQCAGTGTSRHHREEDTCFQGGLAVGDCYHVAIDFPMRGEPYPLAFVFSGFMGADHRDMWSSGVLMPFGDE